MTREEKLAYQRGYAAGIHGKWPSHRPPQPPNQIVADLLAALREIRDHLDSELAVIDDPEWEAAFAPIIDKADAAAELVTAWLVDQNTTAKENDELSRQDNKFNR